MGSNLRRFCLRFFLGLGLFHLLMVGCGVCGFEFSESNKVGRFLNFYGEVSGAGHSYGFFAPGVFSQLRAQFKVTEHSGRSQLVALENGSSHEAELRIGNIIDQFTSDADNRLKFTRTLAASLAGSIFGRYPQARFVEIRLERYTAVSMAEFRRGSRALWEPQYSAKFSQVKSPALE